MTGSNSAAAASRYLLISPCRDEAQHIERTLESVDAQSVRPALWIIVDDGSRDRTREILDHYAQRLDYMRVVRRPPRARRSVGPGVVDAFYAGLAQVELADYPYLCKLDLDLVLPPRYFEILLERMHSDPRLGTCSGKPYVRRGGVGGLNGALVSEGCGDEMSVGMTKLYRRECFEQIGGFIREVMWDGIDCHRCRMLGWTARSWDEPELRFVHLRPMGSSQDGIIVGRMRHGYGQYYMGTSPAYMAASAVYRMARRPWVVGGLAMGWGYLRAMLARQPRYPDAQFRRFLRRYQWRCLVMGKGKACRAMEQEGRVAMRECEPSRDVVKREEDFKRTDHC